MFGGGGSWMQLPTPYYTALLYTTSTVILVLQCLYYDYFYKCWRNKEKEPIQEVEEVKKPLKPPKPDATTIPIPSGTAEVTPEKDVYYYAKIVGRQHTSTFSMMREIKVHPRNMLANLSQSRDL
ncbi:Protein GLUTAMINE DUMPER 3 [Olea europaea subsp. europaea]|uniref:Protein GLUTAMINE DUMPER 3 n=1 Tax=Olea europaea subsp. europaea TaxID=158383 RepID=A0A8S0V0E0_OLEEU|nr:Protein GLUTAMINE DUMPER 3 [Olea europaea subsp. europaea]